MTNEPAKDDVAEVFRHAYQHLTDQVDLNDAEWPPTAAPVSLSSLDHRRRWQPRAALWVSLVGAAFAGGWLLSPTSTSEPGLGSILQDEQSAPAVIAVDAVAYDSHGDAAVAAALGVKSDLVDPRVTGAVVIFSDAATVDLRVEVQAAGFCSWFGVVGQVESGSLKWRGGESDVGCNE